MTTAEFLSHLRSLNVKLWAEGERLRCNASKEVLTPELRAELEDRKEKILIFLREALEAACSTTPSLRTVSREGNLPLSFAQQRLWFLDQLMPGSVGYNMRRALRIRGRLNVTALERSLTEIMNRHEALRTCFISVDDQPIQRIAPMEPFALPVIDLCDLPESEREAEAQRLADEEAVRPFDLTRDLLLRAKLLRLGAEHYVLFYTMHHIASDGWSMGIFARELSALYDAFSQRKPSPLPELPIQYADFAVWQREWLQGEALQSQLSYWKRQLEGAPAVLELPTDRPRPPEQGHRGATQSFVLPGNLSEALKALSRREGVTLFMALLAAFKVLLYRYTGQEDVVVGSPIAGRNRPELEGLIGFFVNTLVLRTDLSGNVTFRELLRRVRKASLGAYAHQDLPFEKLVEVLHPKRAASHRPLVQIAFAFQNVPRHALKLASLTVHPLQTNLETAKLDLTLFMWEGEEGLAGSLEYLTDLFDGTTISRMLEHFQTLLEAVVADPERRLLELPVLTGRALPVKIAKASKEEKADIYERSNLTKNQFLVWAGQKLQPEVPLYDVAFTFAIDGEVDRVHFKKAFQTLLNSSDALRTVIREIDGIPQQSVIPDFRYELEYRDFSQVSEPHAAFQTWLQTRCRVPFDLEERLFDSVLAKISEKQFIWYLNQHHIITDGWSTQLVFRRVAELYGRSLEGRLEERVELPLFQDYIDYERAYRRSPRYREVETYWKKKLAEEFDLPGFFGKAPLKRTTQVRRISCDLGTERTQKLKRLALRKEILWLTEHGSMFTIFAALLFTYLYRVTGSRRHSIGTPFHNRREKAFKDTLGLLMEVLPLRITVGEGDTFVSLINKIKFEASEVLRFSQHSIGNSPQNKVYDVLLNYHTASFPIFQGMSVQTEWVHTGHENDSLAVQIHDFDGSGSLIVDFDLHCDVFDENQSHQVVQHFLKILDAFLANPAQPLDHVSLLTKEEKERILVEFNRTQCALPDDLALPRLFEAQAQRTPDHLALVFEDRSLTYAQLNSKANQLAHYLKSLGVGPEMLVAMCVEPSLDAVIGILGILKAGGAYLPLDPQYPNERLAFMLRDAQVSVLLTQQRIAAELIDFQSSVLDSRIQVICLDAERERIALEPQDTPAHETSPDNVAYVIYTSGSTGDPKGVMISHRGVCNRLLWGQQFYQLADADRVLHAFSLSFDFATWEIFTALIAGAQLILARQEGHQDSSYLVKLIAERRITVAGFVPSMLEAILQEPGIEMCDPLRKVICGAETLSSSLQDRFHTRLGAELQNTYGPTEASIDVTYWVCRCRRETEPKSDLRSVPIGRPIANTQIYMLDSRLQPVPIGVPGELHIGGIGLARGYLNRRDMTAEKFIPDPFSTEPGARMYKSGDLARYLPDGNIEFLGRIDHQVKIRGFRVELGEIEAVLTQYPGIQQAIAVARENAPGNNRLVAYVVPDKETAPTVHALHSFLKQKLPDYMVPSAFVFLDALPLTSNGKVDRQALPIPDRTRPELEEVFVAPRTAVEEVLAGIWAEILGVERVGIHDNFFELGGHSLLATQVISRIRAAFQVELRLRNLFEIPTVAALADAIRRAKHDGVERPTPPISPLPREPHRVELSSPATSQD